MTFIDWYFTVVVFILGSAWGSFLNVCIYRIPAELSVVKPRSRCPKCITNLAWFDNIPIFGWIALRGKCRYCKEPISPRYPAIELLTAVLFTWVWIWYVIQPHLGVHGEGGAVFTWVFNALDFRFLVYWVMVFGLLLGSFVDIDEMWIPDRCTIGGMIVGPIFSFLLPALHGAETRVDGLIESLIGLAAGFGSLWTVSVLGRLALKKDAMGFGDVKLMGALGACLGWQAVIFIIFVSSLLGTIVGGSCIVMGKKNWQAKIPFGPYIAVAALIWMLGGSGLWELYLNWMMSPNLYYLVK